MNVLKFISAALITVFLVFIQLSLIYGAYLYINNPKVLEVYPLLTTIYSININDMIIVKDTDNNLWQFSKEISDYNWEIGDICQVLVDSKGTNTLTDDEVVSVFYSNPLN